MTRTRINARRLMAATIGIGLAGCGGSFGRPALLSTDWLEDGGRSIEAVRERIKSAHPPRGADVVVAVAGNSDRLVGYPLVGGSKWTFEHLLDSRAVVAGQVVVGSGGREVFALDALTGRKLWTRPTGGLAVHGAGDDGAITVLTLASASGRGSTILAIARDGAVLRQIETDKLLGTPAVVSGIAFVPWGNQYISAIEIDSGDELGRAVVREQTSRAWTLGGGLYFGEVGIFRFDSHIKDASKGGATHIAVPERELPGTPKLMDPGTEVPGPVASGTDKIRLNARPSGPDGPLGIDSDRFYATYFRIVMGFESTKGELAWVHTHSSDVIDGDAGQGSLVLCDEEGKITYLDAKTGGTLGGAEFGEPIKSCVVQVDGFIPGGTAKNVPPLAIQIAQAVANRESEMATAQRLLLRELAILPDESVTGTLVDLASDPRTIPILLADARTALANRRNGASYMLNSLKRHYDYLKDILRAPPVGPMAQALSAMNEKRAAPLLATHLLDPADTDDDIRQAAAALVVLGGPSESQAIEQFLALYRSTAETEDVATAVVSAAQALLKFGANHANEKERNARARSLVEAAVASPMTREEIKSRLESLIKANGSDSPAPAASAVSPSSVVPASSAAPSAPASVPR